MKTVLVPIAVFCLLAATATIPTTSSTKPDLLSSYVSFSIELEGFVNYAGENHQSSKGLLRGIDVKLCTVTGNSSSGVNQYSINLLQNLGSAMSSMPVIRVGGNTADEVIYQSSQRDALNFSCPVAKICMGPSFFDSYQAFPNTLFSHGFNMAWNNDTGYTSLKQTVAKACKALENKLSTWEFGNEPDLYLGRLRPSDWSPSAYVANWKDGTEMIFKQLQETCPSLANAANFTFMAPSIAGNAAKLSPTGVFSAGLDANKTISEVSFHNYMGIAGSSGTSLQHTLMNHEKNVAKLDEHGQLARQIAAMPGMSSIPYILGETNSLAGGGASGISNTFGAALWGLDFNVGASYAAWNPSEGATFAPYYGHLAAAKFMGKSQLRAVLNISLSEDNSLNSAYAGYNTLTGGLDKIAIINFRFYNSSTKAARDNSTYTFKVMPSSNWAIERLEAAGAESVTGVTFGGYAYEYSTMGQPKLVARNGEVAKVGLDGILHMTVLDSTAAILSLQSS
ncbi:hypothetical protein OIDMADRAFT_59521 [Oidiodendron maius Zn]|uniref:Beta-glucuronidase C-terminal domain-containing protein n=1 Tax=Oidiodendron maius (strain Zn) TaxID=913774 RepID=A0A0C3GZS0_OIDMZ|nr:hypothetical protein OIDMADRAFT_59521 [Oidiodendron maius Zn]